MTVDARVPVQADHAVEVRTRILQLSEAEVFAVERGAGHPIVLLHGVTANAYVWEPVASILGRRFLTVAIDQRGHGRSTKAADRRYDATGYATDALEVIEALGNRPALLVGHSLGARNAMTAAVRHPDLVAGVVAIDFTPYIEPEVFDLLEQRVSAGSRSFADLDAVTGYLEGRYPLLPHDAIERRAQYGYAQQADGTLQPLASAEAMRQTCTGLRADLVSTVQALSVPTLVIRGEKSMLVSPLAFDRTVALRGDLETMIVPDADHYVPEEQPEVVAAAVEAFADHLWGGEALEPRVDAGKEPS